MAKQAARQPAHQHERHGGEPGARPAGRHDSPGALSLRAPGVQTQLTVNEPGDRFEQEADGVADQVMRSPASAIGLNPMAIGGVQREEEEPSASAEAQNPRAIRRQATDEEPVQRQPEEEPVQRQAEAEPDQPEAEQASTSIAQAQNPRAIQRVAADRGALQRQEEEPVQRNGEGAPRVSTRTAATIRNPGAGQPLAPAIRGRIEPHLGANLSGVRVHRGPQAGAAAQSLRANAFTHRNHIFLSNNASPANLRLMAHETAHVVQQGAAPVQRQPMRGTTTPQIQRLLGFSLDDLPGIDAAEIARRVPGYTLFTVIIGYNPLTSADVARNATNLLQGLMELVPFGAEIFDALNEHGIIQAAFSWVEQELARLDLSLGRIERALERAWDDIDLVPPFSIGENLDIIIREFRPIYNDVVAFASSLVDQVISMIKEAAIGLAEDLLAENRAWALIKKILHYDPLRGEPVEASTVEILEDFLMLIGKEQELAQMRERGTLERTAAWLDTQIGTFTALLSEFRTLISAAWDAIQPVNLPNLMSNLESLAEQAGGFLQRVWDFALTVALTVLQFVKDALLGWLSGFAHEVPGFHLLTVILGRNPFTNERVPRNAENLIRGFITLLPGGNQSYQELQQTGTIQQAAQRIEGAMADLGISWELITGLFSGTWQSLTIEDLIQPVDAFQRIVNQFGEPIGRLFAFIQVVVRELFTLILQLMNFPTDIVSRIIANAMQAFDDIKRDPAGFFENMLQAVKQGFIGFFDNILQHLLAGVTDWLFGQFRKAGIEPPGEITLESVLGLVMQILGISVERLWEKLGEHIGPENVARIRGAIDRLTGILAFVRDVQERGVAAIWEYIEGQISNLWNMVLEQAKNWIMERVIARVTAKLISMLDPTGIMAVVNSFLAFFNAVQSAIEYFREMLAIVDRYVSTVASVARGDVEPGAEMLEQGLASSIPVAIGFLANQVGLGNLADKIAEIIAGVRALIDQALDWLIGRAVSLARSVLSMLGLGGDRGAAGEFQDAGVAFEAASESHRVWIEEVNDTAVLMVASENPTTVEQILEHLEGRLNELPAEDQNRARTHISNVRARMSNVPLRQVTRVITRSQQGTTTRDAETHVPTVDEVLRDTRPAEERVAGSLRAVFQIFCGLPPAEGGSGKAMAASVTLTVRVNPAEPALEMAPHDVEGQTVMAPAGVRADLGLRRGRSAPYWQLRSEKRLDTGKEPGSIAGGRLRQPAPIAARQTESQVQVLSWATGSGDLNSNISHAEHQFYVWFMAQPVEWRNRVLRMDVRNNPYSPCSQCAGELAALRREHPNIQVAFLTWQKPWDAGVLNTKASDLNAMSSAGWTIHPGAQALEQLGEPC